MDNETRLDIQYEILNFLKNRYYYLSALDDEEAHNLARSDSYEIMKIIKQYIPEK